MFASFSKRVGLFPAWCIGFIILYMLNLLYVSWIVDRPVQQVTYININTNTESESFNTNTLNTATASCDDPVHFIYPCLTRWGRYFGRELHKNMIDIYGFKNTSCLNITGFDLPHKFNLTNMWCAKHNDKKYSNKFCHGGYIIWANNPDIVSQLSKSTMNRILTTYCNDYHTSDNVCNFLLETYNMDNIQQRIEFITKHLDCQNNKSQANKTWLFKEDKHRGTGVHFYNNHKLIYSLLGPNRIEQQKYYNKCTDNASFQTVEYFKNEGLDYVRRDYNSSAYRANYNNLVMQEFISNPLLIENRAFHIRTLHLVASNRDPLIVLQYPQWFIFRNNLEYDNKELDPLKLKSNSHQVGDRWIVNGIGVFKKFWSYNRFQKYLTENYNELNHTKLENEMQKDMVHIAETLFKARSNYNTFKAYLYDNKKVTDILRFDFLCMDTIMNDKFELKFLEMNWQCGVPCEKVNSKNHQIHMEWVGDEPNWCDVLSKEASNILVEIHEKRQNGIDIKNISSLNKFKLVHLEK